MSDHTEEQALPTPAKRRFFSSQFGVRAMLLAVAAVAVACAIVSGMIREGWRHDQIAAQLLKAGAFAEDWSYGTTPDLTLPDWLEPIRRTAPFRRITVVEVGFQSGDFDSQLSALAELGSVRQVIAHSGNDLNAPEAAATAEESSEDPFVGPGNDSYAQVPFGIQELDRLMSQVRVDVLDIDGAELPRGRIPALSRQPLSILSVRWTEFSNPAIVDLPLSLTYFGADGTRITDEGLPSFTRLKKLRTLSIGRTPTTSEAVERLREQMPWCDIQWEPMQVK